MKNNDNIFLNNSGNYIPYQNFSSTAASIFAPSSSDSKSWENMSDVPVIPSELPVEVIYDNELLNK